LRKSPQRECVSLAARLIIRLEAGKGLRIVMKRPGIASTFWFIAFVAVFALLLRHYSVRQPPESQRPSAVTKSDDMIFGIKSFSDIPQILGGFVSISGTLTGDGVGYENNTITVSCYRDRMECEASSIDQIGSNQLGSLYPPVSYPIIQWDTSEEVAQGVGDLDECTRVTISLEHKTETAVWVVEPINQGRAACKATENKIYKWTIEDPPFWKDLKKNKTN
jgi:hypothetical protein